MNFLDLIFPKHCVGCGKIGKYFCDRCVSSIKLIKSNEAICPVCEKLAIDGRTHPGCQTRYSIDGLTSFFRYDGVVRQAIKSIKYRYISDLAIEFITLIPKTSFSFLCHSREGGNLSPRQRWIPDHPPAGGGDDRINNLTLIPVPLHPSRLRWRGFNQAEVLGKLIAVRLNVPVKTNLLSRVRKTVPQVEMRDREKRLKNMEGVFDISELLTVNYRPLTVLLFDDVFTTGATMRAAANVLKRNGVKFVWGVTMAR